MKADPATSLRESKAHTDKVPTSGAGILEDVPDSHGCGEHDDWRQRQ
jgi:hypothetical protein